MYQISTHVIPLICEKNDKDSEYAKIFIKKNICLNNSLISFKQLFNYENIDEKISNILHIVIYKLPYNCLNFKINNYLKLVSIANGITKNKDIVIINDKLSNFDENIYKFIKIVLIANMAIWKSKKSYYYIVKLNKTISVYFDKKKWDLILEKIKLWANDF